MEKLLPIDPPLCLEEIYTSKHTLKILKENREKINEIIERMNQNENI